MEIKTWQILTVLLLGCIIGRWIDAYYVSQMLPAYSKAVGTYCVTATKINCVVDSSVQNKISDYCSISLPTCEKLHNLTRIGTHNDGIYRIGDEVVS